MISDNVFSDWLTSLVTFFDKMLYSPRVTSSTKLNQRKCGDKRVKETYKMCHKKKINDFQFHGEQDLLTQEYINPSISTSLKVINCIMLEIISLTAKVVWKVKRTIICLTNTLKILH